MTFGSENTGCDAVAATTTTSSTMGWHKSSSSDSGISPISRSIRPCRSCSRSAVLGATVISIVTSFSCDSSRLQISGSTSSAAIGPVPMRTCPPCPCAKLLTSRMVSSAEARNRRTRASSTSPTGVRRMLRPSRSNKGLPNACSRRWMLLVSAGWVRPSFSPAWPM